ncbi:conjugative transposon protein TraN [Dyadobacter sp. BHUBP1]|uniref:conjugative transposon protein TraN n=1 Tax=Dyadobacter sp. BHUBP1 TaxID=3424178 RepID=UPI003D32C52A
MKNTVLMMMLTLIAGIACAQQIQRTAPAIRITSIPLAVTAQKTTNLLFPYAIKSVDKGSRDILVQKAKGVDYLLQVKAATTEDFGQTNLTVVTTDGEFYSFLVSYHQNPADLNFRFGAAATAIKETKVLSADNEAVIEQNACLVAESESFLKRPAADRFGIRLALQGIYIQGEHMYYQLRLDNDTYIPYDIAQLRFFIRDQKKVKRMATQETELIPVFTSGNTESLAGQGSQVMVFVFDKHTIPDKKYLAVQLMEHGGGRNLELQTGNKTLVKARPLAPLE